MGKSTFDELGDEQKYYEHLYDAPLMPGLPILVRLDGRAFHTFCRGLSRPFDERLSRAMIETVKYLVEKLHPSIAYTQSDEITLVFPNQDTKTPMLFAGGRLKFASLCASMATAKFNQEIMKRIPEKATLLPHFDGRCDQRPTLDLAANNLRWREMDATRNSLTMAASAFYSHKELHKVNSAGKHELLHKKGINWADYPAFFKRGTFVRRETVLKTLTEAELARIPENRRPTGPVERSQVMELDMPPLSRVTNLNDVLFFKAQPIVASVVENIEDAA